MTTDSPAPVYAIEGAVEPVKPRVLSLEQAGRYLGGDTSPETLRTWIRRGVLRSVHVGRRLFVLREELDRLIDEQLEDAS